MLFTHVLNPFAARPGSGHDLAQSVTFASMRRAVAEARSEGIEVDTLAVVFPSDERAVQSPARSVPVLRRTVQDVTPLHPVRPLPLLRDILQAAYDAGRSEFLVYTNVDISLQPHFYTSVCEMIRERGDDPFVINRRTISEAGADPDRLEPLYAQTGAIHHGHDCFVFRRDWIPKMELGRVCTGAKHFDDLLVANLGVLSGDRLRIERHLHLTFHLGDDRAWATQLDYENYNLREAVPAMRRLAERYPRAAEGSTFRSMQRFLEGNTTLRRRVVRSLRRIGPLVRLRRWILEESPLRRPEPALATATASAPVLRGTPAPVHRPVAVAGRDASSAAETRRAPRPRRRTEELVPR
jgi:hypothetical protein